MDDNKRHSVLRIFRNFFFSSTNGEFLIFLFFFALSGAFWLLMALNETYEREITIPIKLVDIPEKTVLSSDTTIIVRLNIRDKGYTLLTYKYGDKLRTVKVNFANYQKSNGRGLVSSAELQKLIYSRLFSSSRIVSMKPDRFEYLFSYGKAKRVPIKIKGSVAAGKNYYLSRIELTPDSIDIYAEKNLIDSISYVTTAQLKIKNITDTLVRNVKVNKRRGVKYVPEQVKLTVYPDVLTEERVEVPITAVNMPDGKVLRTFPGRVTVTFTCGASMFRSIRPEQFKIVADYAEIAKLQSDKCNIYLRAVPHGVRNPRLSISQVDYLIEEQ